MTPHILNPSEITEEDLLEIWAGTEQNLAYREVPPAQEIAPERALKSIQPREKAPEEKPKEEAEPTPAEEEEEKEAEEKEPEEKKPEEKPPSEATLSLSPPTSMVFRGQEISLSIQISRAENLGQIAFELSFDPAILEGIEVGAGEFMQQGEAKISFERQFSKEKGSLRVKLARLGIETGAKGDGTLITFKLKSLAPGISPISFSQVEAYDSQSKPIAVRFSPGQVEVR